jgi:LysM repeat protein
MKIMKVLGVVVGIHVFALILIFANPGCSSTSKPSPAPVDTVVRAEPAPTVSVTGVPSGVSVPMADSGTSPVSAAPIAFNPDAPALTAGGGVRFTPTRPGTAAASTLVAAPVADVTPATTYTVKSGDSLWSIAKKNHLTVGDLATANNLKTSVPLHEGQKLLIPSKPAAPAAAAAASATATPTAPDVPAPKAPANAVKHVVKSGETLSTIAKQYGVKSSDIAVANNITDPQKIRAGMELVIPGWQTPAGKATAAKSAAKGAPASANGGTAKPAVPEIKPLFNAPPSSATPTVGPQAPASGDVPVIKVDETPAPAPAPTPKP